MVTTARNAYVTLLTRNSYLSGVLVLHHGLRQAKSKYPLIVMVTPSLPSQSKNVLQKCGITMREVRILAPPFNHQLAASDSRFADTWTKLRGFALLEYDRVVLLDCDMVVKRNMDELFHIKLARDHIAAVHVCACNPLRYEHYPADWVPKNCAHSAVLDPRCPPPKVTDSSPRPYSQLNSGTLVLRPSKKLADTIHRVLSSEELLKDFLFPDQDLLTIAFRGKWVPLAWYYNAMRTMRSSHRRLWDDEEARCIHYILPEKPWASRKNVCSPEFQTAHRWWWDAFEDMLQTLERIDPEGAQWVSTLVDYT